MTSAVCPPDPSPAEELKVVSWNLLSHKYTKFNKALHGQAGPLESVEQQDTRIARIHAMIHDLDADVLLLQEHDSCVPIPGYRRGVRAFVEHRPEGCSILVADRCRWGVEGAVTLDLSEGKTAAIARWGSAWLVSCHLKGGPESAPVKRAQVQLIVDALRQHHALLCAHGGPTPMHVVWAGDMNDTAPGDTFGDTLAEAGLVLVPPVGCTGLTSDMRTQLTLDHFIVSREIADGPRGVRLSLPLAPDPRGPWAPGSAQGSDHVPVVAVVGIPTLSHSSPHIHRQPLAPDGARTRDMCPPFPWRVPT